jgi:hypothetical protein
MCSSRGSVSSGLVIESESEIIKSVNLRFPSPKESSLSKPFSNPARRVEDAEAKESACPSSTPHTILW